MQWATATLQRGGMPLDPGAPIYSDRDWLRRGREQNAYCSAAWYASEILETVGRLRTFRERGDIDLASNLALHLGMLATEARFLVYMANNARKGGKEKASTSIAREQAAARIADWRSRAFEYWRENPAAHPNRYSQENRR